MTLDAANESAQGDVFDPAVLAQAQAALGGPAHAVLSDLCPDLSGIALFDALRSVATARQALGEPRGGNALERAFGSGGQRRRNEGAAIAAEIAVGQSDPVPGAQHQGLLLPGGNFVGKVIQGVGLTDLVAQARPHFSNVRLFRPKASVGVALASRMASRMPSMVV